jgi:phage tail-like protein
MADFSANRERSSPYKNFAFRVKWNGKYVAGLSKMTLPKQTTELIKHRSGGDPSNTLKRHSRNEYEPITLERGVTYDLEFKKWAFCRQNLGLGSEVLLKDYRKDIIVEVFNEAGKPILAYRVYHCWVSEYQALPDLDGNANAVAIQHIKIENEGWEQDTGAQEPSEISQ